MAPLIISLVILILILTSIALYPTKMKKRFKIQAKVEKILLSYGIKNHLDFYVVQEKGSFFNKHSVERNFMCVMRGDGFKIVFEDKQKVIYYRHSSGQYDWHSPNDYHLPDYIIKNIMILERTLEDIRFERDAIRKRC